MRAKVRAPLPTAAPAAELVARRLDERQDNILDQLCGFESGNFASPLLCQSPYVCATNGNINARGCCTQPLALCYLKSACVESKDLAASCGPVCSSDQNVAKCSLMANPYCYTKYYSVPYGPTQSEVGCTASSGVTVEAALSYSFTSGSISFTFTSATGSAIATGLGNAAATAGTSFTLPTSESSSSESSASSTSASAAAASSSSSGADHKSSGGGGGLSQGAIIGIAVCATVIGLAITGLIFFFLWKRKRNTPPPQQYHNPNQPPPMAAMQSPPPPDIAGAFPHNGDAFHPNNFESFNANFSQMDDDAVAKMRRFSNDGTIEQTVAGRTNDEFRPQAA